jgi:hypothetical protein
MNIARRLPAALPPTASTVSSLSEKANVDATVPAAMKRGRCLDQALMGNEPWVSDAPPLLQDLQAAAARHSTSASRSVDAAVARWSRRGAVCYCSGGQKSRGHATKCLAVGMQAGAGWPATRQARLQKWRWQTPAETSALGSRKQ